MPRLLAAFRSRPLWLAVPLIILWGSGTTYAFWWFELRPLRAFTDEPSGLPVRFDVNGLQALSAQLAQQDGITLFHLWDPECPCNEQNAPHLRQLMADYQEQGISFIALARANGQSDQALQSRAKALFGEGMTVVRADHSTAAVPSSPAALIMDHEGTVAYFGPYSTGAGCSPKGEGFVERALTLTLQGQQLGPMNLVGVGCFCPWDK